MEGLSSADVQKLRNQYGFNEFTTTSDFSILRLIVSQFTSFLILILIIASAVALFLGEIVDGLAILAIVFINAIIGFIQEYKAENAVQALKDMVVPEAIVLRNGEQQKIPVRELVPGDVIFLSEGDKVPADALLHEAQSVKIDEAVLTGESAAVKKSVKDIIYSGTILATGRARAELQTIGMETEFGKIVHLVSKQEAVRSPLAVQINNLAKNLGLIILGVILILLAIGLFQEFELFNLFMTSVALGVSAIPEGLPIILTLTLAAGVLVMSRKNAIVRKMSSVETLGATTVICSDKTGTLTVNEMTVTRVFTMDGEREISGQGYNVTTKMAVLRGKTFEKLCEIAENNNHAVFEKTILGDPTEIALKVLTRKAQHVKQYELMDEKLFTSERKMMSTLHKVRTKKEIFTKGAIEEVLKRCTHYMKAGVSKKLTATVRKEILRNANQYAADALRVIACAYKPFSKTFDEKGLIFVGMVGMIDPPRKGVKEALQTARDAGIAVKIITGDNPMTASAIAEMIGLDVSKVKTGADLDRVKNHRAFLKLVRETTIFARVKPQHKYRIVDALEKSGDVVAVTGDGVNDAPALKRANVGIAMGIKGTEATKEVAEIVLKDDAFPTIVNAIQEGRRIYANILAFIIYMLAANFGALVTVGVLSIGGYALPLLPLQILWINIATDALPALALGYNPASRDSMRQKPRPKNESILKRFRFFIGFGMIFQTLANIVVFFYGSAFDPNMFDLSEPSVARTMVFTQIVMFEMFLAFVCAGQKRYFQTSIRNRFLIIAVILSIGLQLITIYLPFFQRIFKTVPLGMAEWGVIIACSASALLVRPLSDLLSRSR